MPAFPTPPAADWTPAALAPEDREHLLRLLFDEPSDAAVAA